MEIIQSELQLKGLNEFINGGHLSYNDTDFAFIQKVLHYDEDVQKIVNNKFFKGFKFTDERIDRYFKESFVTKFLDREISRQTVEAFASQVLYITLTHEDYIYSVFGSEIQNYLEGRSESKTLAIGKALENAIEQGQTKQRQQNKAHDEYVDNTHNENENNTNNEGGSTDDTRNAESTLPQSEVNIDVSNTELSYADTNNISKNKNAHFDDTNQKGTSDTKADGTKDDTFDGLTNGESDTKRNTQSENENDTQVVSKQYLIDNLVKLYDMRDRIFDTYDKKCFLHIW